MRDAADGVRWAYNNSRLAMELLLVLAVVFVGWRYNVKSEQLSQSMAEHGQLEEGLKQQISVVNGQLEILRKENDKVVVERVYIPPEGSVVIRQKDLEVLMAQYKSLLARLSTATTPEERAALAAEIDRLTAALNSPNIEVTIKDMGFTLKPGFGIEWASNGLSPRLDIKLFYYKRYSIIAGGGRGGLDIAASRHLDDVLFWHPKNVELFGGWKFLRVPGAGAFVIGVRSNF